MLSSRCSKPPVPCVGVVSGPVARQDLNRSGEAVSQPAYRGDIARILAVITEGLPQEPYALGECLVADDNGGADLSEPFDGFDVDTDATAWRLTVGWRFNDYLAVEGGVQQLRSFRAELRC